MANPLVFHNFDNMILLKIHKMASVTDVNRFKDVKIERNKKRITEEKKNNDIFNEIFQNDSNIYKQFQANCGLRKIDFFFNESTINSNFYPNEMNFYRLFVSVTSIFI